MGGWRFMLRSARCFLAGLPAVLFSTLALRVGAQTAEGFVAIDEFEGEQAFTLGARSAGSAWTRDAEGFEGSRGLILQSGAGVGRVSVSWPIRFDMTQGIVFWAQGLSGRAAINVKLIEADGDRWSAWVGLRSEWRQFGLALSDFEFVQAGNGVRESPSVRRLELEAVLTGDELDKRCAIDRLGTAPAASVSRLRFQPEYFEALMQTAQSLPLGDASSLQKIESQLQEKPQASVDERLRILKEGLGGLLRAARSRAEALGDEYAAGEPGLSWPEGRKAELSRREGELYGLRVGELSQRLADYDLTYEEMEEALLYSRRMLERLEAAVSALNKPRSSPLQPAPEPVAAPQAVGVGPRSSIMLNGVWDFLSAAGEQEPPKSGWTTLCVPHGFWRQTLGTNFLAGPGAEPGARGAWLRRKVCVPAEWAGRRAALSFLGAGHCVEAWVNETYCGSHVGGFEPFEIEVGHAIRPGETNEIYLFVCDSALTAEGVLDPLVARGVYPGVKAGPGPNAYLAMGGPDAANAGVWDDVSLESSPQLHIRSVAIQTSVRERLLSVRVEVANDSAQPRTFQVESEVVDGGQTLLRMTGPREAVLQPGQSGEISLSQPWADYEPWGPGPPYGRPRLYWLRTRLSAGGATGDELVERFGFRQFEIASTGFALNGRPIVLRGDRLSASEGGKTWERANPWYFARYLRLARKANINFVLLDSETPQSWLDLCDEMGMLCVPASPIKGLVGRAPSDLFGLDDYHDPLWRHDAEEQMAAWARAHRNHPSVVARVAESGSFGEDVFWAHGGGAPSQGRKTREMMEAAFALDAAVRGADPTLPIFHLDTERADADPRFEVCARRAPFTAADWRRKSLGRPLLAEILRPATSAALPSEDELRLADREGAARALDRLSQWLDGVIRELIQNDVPAIILPNLQAGLYTTARRELMGPWFSLTAERLEAYPREEPRPGVTLVRVDEGIRPVWPALCGPGIRVEAFDLADGLSTWINWFEPKTPLATPNRICQTVREAFEPCPPLGEPQRAEVIVQLPGGQASAGRTVFLTLADGVGGPSQGVVADERGRAWFILLRPGRYQATVDRATGSGQAIDVPPSPPDPQPGFGHVSLVNLGGA